MRSNVTQGLRCALAILLLAALGSAQAAVVLMYHRVGEDAIPATNVRVEQFEAHLEYLDARGYTVLSLPGLIEHLRQGEPLPDRSVAISFDDAYSSIYTHAWPRLRERGLPFTIFVSTASVDRPGYMSWTQLRELAAAGVSIANHSHSHAKLNERLPGESTENWLKRVTEDVEHAQRRIRQEIGAGVNEAPRLFAYPYGEYNEALAEQLRSLGYIAFGQHSGAIGAGSDLRALPRFPMNEIYGRPASFAEKLDTLPLPLTRIQPWDPSVTENPPLLRLQLKPEVPAWRVTCFYDGEPMSAQVSADEIRVRAPEPLPPGRSRYNCTAPAGSGRYYWYSHPWVVPGGRD